MFKKPKRSFQQRQRIIDPDENTDEESVEQIKEQEEAVKPPVARVSFQDEEDADSEFQVKKSSFSRRVTKQLEKERLKREQELRAKEKSLNSVDDGQSVRKQMERNNVRDRGGSEEVTKSVKEETREIEVIQIPEEDHFSDDSEVEETESKGLSSISFRTAMERGVIPDAKAIFHARKQRQRARDIEDFIAINSDPRNEEEENRIEQDDDDHEDEEIEFSVKTTSIKDRVRQSMAEAAESGSDESEDEVTRWEQEQIKKGVGNSDRLMAQIEAEKSRAQSLSHTLRDTRLSAVPSHLLEKQEDPIPINLIFERLKEALQVSREKVDHLERSLINVGIETELAEDESARLKERQQSLIEERNRLLDTMKDKKNNFGC